MLFAVNSSGGCKMVVVGNAKKNLKIWALEWGYILLFLAMCFRQHWSFSLSFYLIRLNFSTYSCWIILKFCVYLIKDKHSRNIQNQGISKRKKNTVPNFTMYSKYNLWLTVLRYNIKVCIISFQVPPTTPFNQNSIFFFIMEKFRSFIHF